MTTICRHIKINGERCGCPALRDHAFCYFHRTLADRHPRPPAPETGVPGQLAGWGGDPTPTTTRPMDPLRELQLAAINQSNLNLPPLEDRESIQLAASIIIGALARNVLDTKRAATLLYGLQVASANVRNLKHSPSMSYLVTETTLTPAGDEIAPDEDPEGEILYQELLQNLTRGEDDDEEDEYGAESEEAA